MVTKRQMVIKKRILMFQSYLRSCLAAVVAVVATGNLSKVDLLKALLAAGLPPIIRWLNPNDEAFGRAK